MVDEESWIYEQTFWLDAANFHKERVAADEFLLLPYETQVLTERGALALFFGD